MTNSTGSQVAAWAGNPLGKENSNRTKKQAANENRISPASPARKNSRRRHTPLIMRSTITRSPAY